MLPQAVVALFVGALLGFAGGYFAGGGGRPAGSSVAPPAGEALAGNPRLIELTREIERDPENPRLLTELGNLQYDDEAWEDAIASYEKARRKAPADPRLLSDLGAAHRNAGDFDLAVAYFRKAREADAEHWQALLNWVLVEAYDRKDAAEAQRLFDELKKKYPAIPLLDRIQSQISSLRAGA